MQRSAFSQFYPESDFGGFSDVDGTIRFFTRVHALLTPESVVLDIGCGRGGRTANVVGSYKDRLQTLRGGVKKVVGIDVDPGANANPYVDEFRLVQGENWPVEDSSVDIAIADWVLEHVTDPAAFFRESMRVLRPGGVICLRTSNVLGYVGTISRLVPNQLHSRLLRRANPARAEADIFPTIYRCNTPGRVRRALEKAGLQPVVFTVESEPHYLAFSRLAYRAGVWFQRWGPSVCRNAIFAFARKPAF